MAAKKRTAKTEITAQTYELVHAAYVAARRTIGCDPPTLREVARTFSVPFAEVDRRATVEHWEEERAANLARQWWADFGEGAKTEEEFYERENKSTHAHIIGTPEGERWLRARARRTWAWYTSRVSVWESIVEERAASAALENAQRGDMKCLTCPRRAA